jgi:hypothetical protein
MLDELNIVKCAISEGEVVGVGKPPPLRII